MVSNKVNVWLINTGWTGGQYGVGLRISLKNTRALIHAALDGRLKQVEYQVQPLFKLSIPTECEGSSSAILNPRNTWDDKTAYDAKSKRIGIGF